MLLYSHQIDVVPSHRFFLFIATEYIKYFGYVQFGGVFAAPLCSLLFRGNFNEKLNAEEDFAKKVRILILPGFVFVLLLVLLDALQLITDIHLSVSYKFVIAFCFLQVNWLFR